MSDWLNEIERDFRYECASGHKSYYRMPNSTPDEVTRADAVCQECGEVAEYTGFLPTKLGMTGKVLFEQNGRYAYEIRRPDGTITRMSKTKYDYLESFGRGDVDPTTGKAACAHIVPAYTPAYQEHLRKVGRSDLLQESFVNEKARKPAAGTINKVKPGERT